jgi:hypothetical protein
MSKKTGQHYDIHKFSSDRALALRILIMLNNKLLTHFLNGEPRSRETARFTDRLPNVYFEIFITFSPLTFAFAFINDPLIGNLATFVRIPVSFL